MAYDPSIHHRKTIRLKGYDYAAPGAYFVTIVAHRRLPIFGEITGGVMQLNACGEIVRAEWLRTAAIRREIALDEFVVMPDHFHAIVMITECDGGSVGAQRRCAPTHPPGMNVVPGSVGAIIRAFKSAVTTRINQLRGIPGTPVWQRNYWEHVIRNDGELSRIREYIRNNPITCETDDEYHHQHCMAS
jgi:REP element-mobilizing transposase RayT